MNILCMSYEYPPIGGGGANVARPLARSLTELGHSVHVLTSGMNNLARHQQVDGVHVYRTWCLRRHASYTTTPELLTYLLPTYRKALELTRNVDFDVNHTHFAMPTGIVSYLLKKKTGLPYVLTVHGSDVPDYNPDRFALAHKVAKPLWRRIIHSAESIIAPSQFMKNLLQSHIDAPVQVIPNGYGKPQESFPLTAKQDRILVVARLFPRKGVQYFIDALKGLDTGWDIVVAGDGPYLAELKQRAHDAAVPVRFVGYVRGRELQELYATAKIFVFPSLQENFPNVLLEAMDAGCAIITTNAHGCAEVVGESGLTTPAAQPDVLRQALSRLLHQPEEIERLGSLARARIHQFGWPHIAAAYDQILRAAAQRP